MLLLAAETCVSGLGAAHKSPALRWERSLSVSPAVPAAFACLGVLARSQRRVYRPDFQALKETQPAEVFCQAPREWRLALNSVSHRTEAPGGRQRQTPQKQLEVRWLFHVFMSQW